MSDWNQPICNACWIDKEGGRQPVRLSDPLEEKCCLCGNETTSGIYIRANPIKVPYPTRGVLDD